MLNCIDFEPVRAATLLSFASWDVASLRFRILRERGERGDLRLNNVNVKRTHDLGILQLPQNKI